MGVVMISAGHCGLDRTPDGLGGCSGNADCTCECTACLRRVVRQLRANVQASARRADAADARVTAATSKARERALDAAAHLFAPAATYRGEVVIERIFELIRRGAER